jgi:hypothetical protein
MPQLAVDAAGDVMEFGSSALESSRTALGKGAEIGSAALGASKEYGAAALGVGKNVLGKATNLFSRSWSKSIPHMSGGGQINFLQGRELDEFNETIGVHLYSLHDRLTEAFFNKYGKNTVLDKNGLELVMFMEKSYDLLLHSILPWVASKFRHCRAIEVEPGLRKALILRAFCNKKTNLKSKYLKASRSKSKKSKRN